MGRQRDPEKVSITPFREADLKQVIETYKSAFREPPWNEIWSDEQVREDLDYARSKTNNLILVAKRNDSKVIGFTWGYLVPFDEFPFLRGRISGNSVYMDEIAVDPANRQMGIGRFLCTTFMRSYEGFDEIVLRTDENNVASMKLFASLGFSVIGKVDERYPSRPYLKASLIECARP